MVVSPDKSALLWMYGREIDRSPAEISCEEISQVDMIDGLLRGGFLQAAPFFDGYRFSARFARHRSRLIASTSRFASKGLGRSQAYTGTGTFEPGFGCTIADAVVGSCSAYPFFKEKLCRRAPSFLHRLRVNFQ
jgi:hypothetical protein